MLWLCAGTPDKGVKEVWAVGMPSLDLVPAQSEILRTQSVSKEEGTLRGTKLLIED